MEGSNELRINQLTMIKAMQYYLEKIMTAPVPKVKSVKMTTESRSGDYFVIEVHGEVTDL